MPLKTENQYEDLFGDHIALLTGLNRDNLVRPMKQIGGTRVAKRVGNLLEGLKPSDNWVAYHVKFSEDFEEPYTLPEQDKVIAKRFLRVEYNFYGPDAANNILIFKQLLYTQASYNQLIKDGIVYSIIQSNVVDMDQMINEQWWNRRILSVNYLESVVIEFPAGVVEEVVQTEVEINLINNLSAIIGFQELDNRDQDSDPFKEWNFARAEVEGAYIRVSKGFNVTQYAASQLINFEPNTVYTLLVYLVENDPVAINWEFSALITGVDRIIIAEQSEQPGIKSFIFTTDGTTNSKSVSFSLPNTLNGGGSVLFKAAIVKGNWLFVNKSEKTRVIETIEYGPTNP